MISPNLIKTLNDSKLSNEEFMLCYLIYLNGIEEGINVAFAKYVEINAGKFDYQLLIDNLEKQRFLENLNRKGEFQLDKLRVTEKFSKKIFVDVDLAFKEVYNAYPKSITWKDNGINRVTPTFKNEIHDSLLYQQFLSGYRRDKHIEFMAVLEQLVESNRGKAICKFSTLLEGFEGYKAALEEVNKANTNDDLFEMG